MTTSAHYPNKFLSEAGFTLVELLVALVVAILGMSAILVANLGQHQSYNTQLQVADARQKARGVIAMLRSDLLQGHDFTQVANTPVSMTLAWQDTTIPPPNFTAVTYRWAANPNQLWRGVGIGANAAAAAAISSAPATQTVFADGIDGFNFDYQPSNAEPNYVVVSLVARASGVDPHYSDQDNYLTLLGNGSWPQPALNGVPLGDNFHRRFWQETVFCRNQTQGQ